MKPMNIMDLLQVNDLKDGNCEIFGWKIDDDEDQEAFDRVGELTFVVDPDDLIEETNENNNEDLYEDIVECLDSDGGKDYSVKGTTEGKNSFDEYGSFVDICDPNSLATRRIVCR